MLFERTSSFVADYKRLSDDDKKLFRDAIADFNRACDEREADPAAEWPAHLRVKRVKGTRSVWEMTWSFKRPDGRATWERVAIAVDEDGETVAKPGIRWRRVGNHGIFRDP